MPDELTELLIDQAEEIRDTKRQLGELAKVTGIQTIKSGTIKVFRKRWINYIKNISGDVLVWGNPVYGIWGSYKWGSTVDSSFILGLGVLGLNTLGSQTSEWKINEISDYPGLLGPSLIAWYEFEDLDGENNLESSI